MTKAPNTEGVAKALKNKQRVRKPPAGTAGARAVPHRVEIEIDESTGLPVDCPVTALGINRHTRYYLDANRQLIELDPRGHARLGIQALFGIHVARLYDYWPRTNQDGIVTGWRPEFAAEKLMAAAARRGVWDPFDRVRGAGGWLSDSGELVLHCGDRLYIGGSWREPGLVGRYVYPSAPPVPPPSEDAVPGGPKGPAQRFLETLCTWNFRRGEIDAMLLLGWLGCGILGGATSWRPAVWLTGGRGTGKSTLLDYIKALFTTTGLVPASDASAAGVWQKLGYRTLPVSIDEAEAEEDNRKMQALIKLARQAASGGLVLRGGADHNSTEFVARSCFLFSSILLPPLLSQDRSRLAILELGELAKDAVPPALTNAELRELGQQFRRRLVDNWKRWHPTFEMFRAALTRAGHSARGADQFGALLAAADLLLHDHETDTDSADRLAEKLKAADLAELENDERDESRCIATLLSKQIDPFKSGKRRLVGGWISEALEPYRAPEPMNNDPGHDPDEARRVLGTYGLGLKQDKAGKLYLAIANYHSELAKLFEGTHWAGRSGTMGVWVQAVQRINGAFIPRNKAGKSKTLWFAGAPSKGTYIPLDSVLPMTEASSDQDDAKP